MINGFKKLISLHGSECLFDGQSFLGVLSAAAVTDGNGAGTMDEFLLKTITIDTPEGIREGSYLTISNTRYRVQTTLRSGIFTQYRVIRP